MSDPKHVDHVVQCKQERRYSDARPDLEVVAWRVPMMVLGITACCSELCNHIVTFGYVKDKVIVDPDLEFPIQWGLHV